MSSRHEKTVAEFVRHNFRHFNAATLVDAADGWRTLVDDGGAMFVTLAGAMSTAELGVSLAELIRADKVHGICCTGANLEEDLFNLVAHEHYVRVPHYRDLSPQDEQVLLESHLNRVTDTCIPEEEAMRRVERVVSQQWKDADAERRRLLPHEFLYRIIRDGSLEEHYQIDPADSWLVAACEKDLPIFVPGWEDSTLGNFFAAECMRGGIADPTTMRGGIEYMIELPRDGCAATDRLFPDRRRNRRGLSDLCGSDAAPGSQIRRRAAVELLLPDQRLDDELRLLLGGGSQREDHLGEARA